MPDIPAIVSRLGPARPQRYVEFPPDRGLAQRGTGLVE
jgi:hypothetical protein